VRHYGAVREDGFDTAQLRAHRPEAQDSQAAGIGRHRSADGGAAPAGDEDPEIQARVGVRHLLQGDRLVSAGLLTREDAGPGRRAAYSLTEASIQLVPVFAQLGEWGLHHRPTTKRLRVRAELLTVGGPELWREFMAELRTIHLGEPAPERDRPSVMERLAEAYAAAL